jgi:hypothetical protein
VRLSGEEEGDDELIFDQGGLVCNAEQVTLVYCTRSFLLVCYYSHERPY